MRRIRRPRHLMTNVYRAQQCSWCGHPLHLAGPCPGHIQTGTDKKPNPRPCPCARSRVRTIPHPETLQPKGTP